MAAYTKLSTKNITDLLKNYDLGPLEDSTPLSGGQANSSYRLATPKGLFTLSVCDEKTEEEVRVLTRVLTFLEAQSFPATRLVRPVKGNSFISHGSKPVYIKEFLDGETCRELTRPMLIQVGKAMARLHGLSSPRGVPEAFPYGLAHFAEVLDAGTGHPFENWLAEKMAWLDTNLDRSMARGFIHGDVFWDNLLFKNSTLTAVLDFEEACQYFLLYDLGMAAVGCCAKDGRFDPEKINNLLEGYQAARPMSDAEKDQFRPFLVYAATAAAFWRFRQYNLRRPDPELADSYRELAALADQAPGLSLVL
ncbi:MAG: homoserine kinase [Desulfobacterales bacterium]|nr:homoserine kinase [Desulfobacterales bacterium]